MRKLSTTTRRAVLVGIAAAPVANVPALAAENDPMLAAVERYMLAQAASKAANADAMSDNSRLTEDDRQAIWEAEMIAFQNVLNLTPLTAAGCVAQLRCVESFCSHQDHHLFHNWYEPVSKPGATLLGRIADVLQSRMVQA